MKKYCLKRQNLTATPIPTVTLLGVAGVGGVDVGVAMDVGVAVDVAAGAVGVVDVVSDPLSGVASAGADDALALALALVLINVLVLALVSVLVLAIYSHSTSYSCYCS